MFGRGTNGRQSGAQSLLWCVFSCAVRFDDCVNRLLQPGYVQTYGFSPVCVRR